MFCFRVYEIKTEKKLKNHTDSCSIITVISRSGFLIINDKKYPLEKFNNIIVSVTISKFKIVGSLKIIEAWL